MLCSQAHTEVKWPVRKAECAGGQKALGQPLLAQGNCQEPNASHIRGLSRSSTHLARRNMAKPEEPALSQQGKSRIVFSSQVCFSPWGMKGAVYFTPWLPRLISQKPAVRAPRTLVMSPARPAAESGQWACLCRWRGQVSLLIPEESGDDVTHSKEALPCLCNNEACVLRSAFYLKDRKGRREQHC